MKKVIIIIFSGLLMTSCAYLTGGVVGSLASQKPAKQVSEQSESVSGVLKDIPFIDDAGNEYNDNYYWRQKIKEEEEKYKREYEGWVEFEVVDDPFVKAQKEREQKKKEELQRLAQKYGKKYIDAIQNENKLLVGTPESLIINEMKSELIQESRYTRIYNVYGHNWITGEWTASWRVEVDIQTHKVRNVFYY